jgi:hypothetical protein
LQSIAASQAPATICLTPRTPCDVSNNLSSSEGSLLDYPEPEEEKKEETIVQNPLQIGN